jgi:hypothetical protein
MKLIPTYLLSKGLFLSLIIIAEKKKGTTNEQFHPTHPNLKKRERTYPSRSKLIPDFLKK